MFLSRAGIDLSNTAHQQSRNLKEADDRLRGLERSHAAEPTRESALRLSREHIRAGNHDRAYDTLLPHSDDLRRDGRDVLSKAAAGVYQGLKAKHKEQGHLDLEELHRAGDTQAHILSHDTQQRSSNSRDAFNHVDTKFRSKDDKHRLLVRHHFDKGKLRATSVDHMQRFGQYHRTHREGGPKSTFVYHDRHRPGAVQSKRFTYGQRGSWSRIEDEDHGPNGEITGKETHLPSEG